MTPLSKKAFWILFAVLATAILSSIFNEWAPLIVMACFIVFVILTTSFDTLNNLFFLSIPLSIEMRIPGLGDIMFPSELLAVIIFCFTAVNFINRRKLWTSQSYHPTTGAFILLWIGLFISMCASNMLITSLKSLIIFTIYLSAFYLQWFLEPSDATRKIKNAIGYYFVGLLAVCIITTLEHSTYDFARRMAMRVPPPFFSDHTIYGTCMAFFVPVLYYWMKVASNNYTRVLMICIFLLFVGAIFTTYSRAVWMSLMVVLGVYYLLYLRVPIKKLVIITAWALVVLVIFQDTAVDLISQNTSDSKSRKAGVSDQLKSVTNISTDVSNLERINRWKSAINMFKDKPLTGYGAGTYQFNFIPFQNPADKTPISVNRASDNFSQGMGGTAHSQYLLYASEGGVIVLLAFLASIFYTIKEGFNLYYNSTDAKEKLYIKALLGGYVTFVFHSFFNNFLDIDKSASLFFIFSAGIIILALEKKNRLTSYTKQQTNGN